MAKNKLSIGGIVYSTNPSFNRDDNSIGDKKNILKEHQHLKIKLETKHRAGKAVSLVLGFAGTEEEGEELCKKLKMFCGTGGSLKENEIIVQGDNREKILKWLLKNGYKNSKII